MEARRDPREGYTIILEDGLHELNKLRLGRTIETELHEPANPEDPKILSLRHGKTASTKGIDIDHFPQKVPWPEVQHIIVIISRLALDSLRDYGRYQIKHHTHGLVYLARAEN